jgi:hypothetical protein
MTWPIVPKDGDRTSALDGIKLNLGVIDYTTTSRFGRVPLVPLYDCQLG